MGLASRNARCTAVRPSRKGAACTEPRSGADAVTKAASALIKMRASARSGSRAVPSSFIVNPHATADAVIRCMATVRTTSTAGMSPISGLRESQRRGRESYSRLLPLHLHTFRGDLGRRKRGFDPHLTIT
jgi:hypothetical protein